MTTLHCGLLAMKWSRVRVGDTSRDGFARVTAIGMANRKGIAHKDENQLIASS